MDAATAETHRLHEDASRAENWKRWGPYLAERQWATVREDYSPDGTCWDYFPHDHARSRAYRWGEDGLLGITDRECRVCFALALWNGRDPILKERLFGLTGPEGNHGEDVKEDYFYLDSTPTHSYMKALYKYPQAEFPYTQLVEENRRRGLDASEFELADTGVFAENRYFDVIAEYAKASPDDTLVRISVHNRGPQTATLHLLPTVWFRNTWSWGCKHEGYSPKPHMVLEDKDLVSLTHETLGGFALQIGSAPDGTTPQVLFTENETNYARLFGTPNQSPYVKDAFHSFVVNGHAATVNPKQCGTKAAAHYVLTLAPGESTEVRLRLAARKEMNRDVTAKSSDDIFARRIREAEEFYTPLIPTQFSAESRNVMRQAYAGLLWTKQFYHYIVRDWMEGDPEMPSPPASRLKVRNAEWAQLYSRDVLSVPDKWEYPWFAAWDLAFHMIPFAEIDPEFAKSQLVLLLREWYMHPNGQIPAYEFAFGDVNPPVHAWAAWRVYKIATKKGERDTDFLERTFTKLLLNFTWWVNRKDQDGRNLFSGGFLGLDNIGVFDRSKPLPTGGTLQQADGTAWMAFNCLTMMDIAMELVHEGSKPRVAYGDLASKFFEHFIQITDAMNTLGGTGLWDEEDGFYYDQIRIDGGTPVRLKVRSLVGLLPLIAVTVLEQETIDLLPGFKKRFSWFLENRRDLAKHISWTEADCCPGHHRWLLAIPSKERLIRVLRYLLDESEFLSTYGIRSLSKFHAHHPYILRAGGEEFRVEYVPGESTTALFGGNSNWRGPIWFPVNYLIVEALERYYHYYGDDFQVECPTGSGNFCTLQEAANEISRRLTGLFLINKNGQRPCHGKNDTYKKDPNRRDLVLFHEYFHGETGEGLGASHQTGWTALVVRCIENARQHHTVEFNHAEEATEFSRQTSLNDENIGK
ncbi:MAG: glucosidase [Candidatus Hydrogenedentes bacterium]|nr:glucosidase [Candidatus Hydrogenedentota bacterium]